jgi:hypothetical protein
MQKLPLVLVLCLAALFVAGCGGGPVSRTAAVDNLVSTLDSGPSWASAADIAVAESFVQYQAVENGRSIGACAFVNEHNSRNGFACYLETSLLPGAEHFYFHENANGSDARPISKAAYNSELAFGVLEHDLRPGQTVTVRM